MQEALLTMDVHKHVSKYRQLLLEKIQKLLSVVDSPPSSTIKYSLCSRDSKTGVEFAPQLL